MLCGERFRIFHDSRAEPIPGSAAGGRGAAHLILEVAASFWLLPKVWKDVDWPSLNWILLGVLVGTPLGVYLLATVSDVLMHVSISLVVIILVILLRLGFGFKNMPDRLATSLIGLVSGVLNGGAAIGGCRSSYLGCSSSCWSCPWLRWSGQCGNGGFGSFSVRNYYSGN